VPADVRCTDNSARPDDPLWSQSTGCGDAISRASGLPSSVTSQSRSRDRCHRPAATAATIGAAGRGVLKEINLADLEGCERVPVGAAMATPWVTATVNHA
jgi:hypothetical protein